MPQYLTERDVQDYGTDLVDFAQRAAVHAVAPHLQNLEQQNAELQRRLAREARYSLDQRVEQAVPNYREIDSNPEWHRWLLTVDSLSGRVRQQLLDEAIASGDAGRIAAFFRGFSREAGATSQSHASSHASSGHAYSRARSSGNGKPVYTRSQVQQLYSAHRKGAYAGRDAEWARIDTDIISAAAEGRILNPDIITK